MIAENGMRQFVNNHVFEDRRSDKEKGCIDHNNPSRGTAAPLRYRKAEINRTDPCAECLMIESSDQTRDAGCFGVDQSLPEESMERETAEIWSNKNSESLSTSSDTGAGSREESEVVGFARCKTNGQCLSSAQEMMERVNDPSFLFFLKMLPHATEEVFNMFVFFGPGEIFGQANDDGVTPVQSPRMLVPCALNPVPEGFGGHRSC